MSKNNQNGAQRFGLVSSFSNPVRQGHPPVDREVQKRLQELEKEYVNSPTEPTAAPDTDRVWSMAQAVGAGVEQPTEQTGQLAIQVVGDMGFISFLAISLLITSSILLSGCESDRGPGIQEQVGADGIITRMELSDLVETNEMASAAIVQERMAKYLASKPPGNGSSNYQALGNTNAPGFDPFEERGCPPEGAAKTETKAASNLLKNRITTPLNRDIDINVTLSALRAPGNDENRWSAGRAAVLEGYVRKIVGTGAESCNCGETERRLTDAHIEVASGPEDLAKSAAVIAEITPPWRLLHEHDGLEDWSTKAVISKYQGHRVRITGWLFFDSDHYNEANNTDPQDSHGKENWRATCWEVHPVTSIEIIE